MSSVPEKKKTSMQKAQTNQRQRKICSIRSWLLIVMRKNCIDKFYIYKDFKKILSSQIRFTLHFDLFCYNFKCRCEQSDFSKKDLK